jgi:hypothetical protein
VYSISIVCESTMDPVVSILQTLVVNLMSTVDFPKMKFSPLRVIFVECPSVTSNGEIEVKFTTESTCLLTC